MATVKYPVPVFHFTVGFGGDNADFTEVGGLSFSMQTIDYRGGASKNFLPIKLPGLPEVQNITLKKGIFQGDSELHQWLWSGVQYKNPNDVERKTLTITMMDASHQPIITWKIKDAWPSKYDGPGLNSTGNEIAVESIELVHEGIEQENNG